MTQKERSITRRDNKGKPPLALLGWRALREVAKVVLWAATEKKPIPYPLNNWRSGGPIVDGINSAMRHEADFLDGLDADPESGLHPLAHNICQNMFTLENILAGRAIDDRYKYEEET